MHQAQWNIDTLDGRGRSGRVLEPLRTQMAILDDAWYGAGRCRLGFLIGGKLLWCHAFDHANWATDQGQVRI